MKGGRPLVSDTKTGFRQTSHPLFCITYQGTDFKKLKFYRKIYLLIEPQALKKVYLIKLLMFIKVSLYNTMEEEAWI
ncbi:hypothetical protein D7Y05_01955 [bacterium 1XD42-54]|nr:hypothetical protein D7Y05_01955 [bacterium 1XD42-54]